MFKNKPFTSRRVFAFRQWSRKSYAVFNSLKLLIKISVLSAVYTLINPVQECKAQSDSTQQTKIIELDEVEVSGQRTPVVYSQIARVVSVITRNDIEQAPVQSVNELLENIPQVDIRQRGTNGIQADISIQGGSFDQTLILLNGINLTDPQTGHHNLNLPIDIESIDRVEVLKGPASRVFGTNAFSGAVNFVTGESKTNQVKASLMAGDFALYRGALSLNYHKGKFTNFFNISKSQCDGYIANTDYNRINLYYHGNAQINRSKLHLLFGYSEKQFGANDFYSARYPNQRESTDTWFSGLKFESNGKVKITPSVYWRRNYDHYKIFTDKYYHNFHFTDVYGMSVNSTVSNFLGKVSFGADYRNEIINSTKLGKTIKVDEQIKVPGRDGLYYSKREERENYSLFLEQNLYKGNFSVSAGMMLNKNTKLEKLQYFPGVDIGFQLLPNLKFHTSVNRSLRLPTYTDLYYEGPQNIGNPELKPEIAWNIESGVKSNNRTINLAFSYFRRWGVNIIDWIWLADEQKWHTENWTKLNTSGFETSIAFKPHNKQMLEKFLQNLTLSYSYTNISKLSDEFDSYYALDNLKHKLNLTIIHKVATRAGFTWNLSYQKRNGDYAKWDPLTSLSVKTPYPSFWLFDGKIFYSEKSIRVFLECTNIFNVNYIDLGNIMQPGRWLKAGIEVSIAGI